MKLDRSTLSNLVGRRIGTYRLERLLGSGRMGVVYLARDDALLRPTALKLLSWAIDEGHGQNPLRWFLEEARAIARIAHPGVVQVYAVASSGQFHYIVMEYVDGMSGDELLARKGRLDPIHATRLLVQTAAALHAAHMVNVIHRDVKPANLLVTHDGKTVKLGDFGMALGPQAALRNDGPLRVGTPYFTAPELWTGVRASPTCDIYSLGATYYRFLTGRHPFEASTLDELQRKHLEAPVPDPRTVDPSIPEICARIVLRCLEKKPSSRFASAQEIAWAARRWLGHDEGALWTDDSGPMPPLESTLHLSSSQFIEPQPWATELGFTATPFDEVDPRRCPYEGSPFVDVYARLRDRFEGREARTLLLTGGPGTGRTTICQRLAMTLSGSQLVFYVRAKRGAGSVLVRVFDAIIGDRMRFDARPACVDALMGALAEGYRNWNGAPLIILDDLHPAPTDAELADLNLLLEKSRTEGTFSLLLVDGVGPYGTLSEHLRSQRPLEEVRVPPLSGFELLQYARAWLRATLRTTPMPLITPDAAFLAVHLSEGNLHQSNRLFRNALYIALLRRERVVGSWHVWAANNPENAPRNLAERSAEPPPGRPDPWPTTEILKILNARRLEAGFPKIRTSR